MRHVQSRMTEEAYKQSTKPTKSAIGSSDEVTVRLKDQANSRAHIHISSVCRSHAAVRRPPCAILVIVHLFCMLAFMFGARSGPNSAKNGSATLSLRGKGRIQTVCEITCESYDGISEEKTE